jgi:hypothetical protein
MTAPSSEPHALATATTVRAQTCAKLAVQDLEVVLASPDGTTGRSQQHQDSADDHRDDPKNPDDVDRGDEADNQ